MKINGKVGNLTPPPAVPKTPEPMVTKFGVGNDVWTPTPVQNFIMIG